MPIPRDVKPLSSMLATFLSFGTLLFLLVRPAAVRADDNLCSLQSSGVNVCNIHWHDGGRGYRMSATIGDPTHSAIRVIESQWNVRTRFLLYYDGLYYPPAPGIYDFASPFSLVAYDIYPPEFVLGGCNPFTTLGCSYTRYTWHSSNPNNAHLIDGDWILNLLQFTLSTEDAHCGDGVHDDVSSVALHEFGHLGYLNHTSDPGAVMYEFVECRRSLSDHDVSSMNNVYLRTGH